MDIVGVITSALIASLASFAGPWAVRQMNLAYDREVEELPAFPIILKPYKWLIALYMLGGLMLGAIVIFGAWAVLARSDGHPVRYNQAWFSILDLPTLIIFLLVLVPACFFARKRIVLEPDKLTYRHWGKNIVLDFHDIANHKVIIGYLTVQRKSDGSTMKISLEFQNIRYLNEVLKRWFSQLGQKHHFVYPD